MGIKYFFSWLRKFFPNHIKTLRIDENLKDDNKVDIDNLLIDMNGIFHYCCQKVYKYGSFKDSRDNIKKKTSSLQKQRELFDMIGEYVSKIINFVRPNKRVYLAIDGPAPLSKINQQRQRRFRSAIENDDGCFDSNCITPGTKFMDNLSKYIDWYIRKNMFNIFREDSRDIEIIFSSEKCPGEGEHKLVNYVREFGLSDESYMIHGMDADLFMLSLATHFPKFHILRENPYRYEREYYYIDVSSIRENIVNVLLCEHSILEDKIHINDFILMIFLTGNDFLPHLPTIEILEGGVENLFETYRNNTASYGSLTTNIATLNINSLKYFIGTLGLYEKEFLEEKRAKSIAFPDRLLEKHTSLGNDGKFVLDFEKYKKEYYQTKMNLTTEEDIKKACIEYIEGLQWVLTYYTSGVPNWYWYYKYSYGPFLSDIVKYIDYYTKPSYLGKHSKPYHPFLQLLCVLPEKSKDLLPEQLQSIMYLNSTKDFYPKDPDNIYIDFDGKHNAYEGVVNLPNINHSIIENEYNKFIKLVDDREQRRNIIGRSFIYTYSYDSDYVYKSFYGDIKDCKVLSRLL
jgi:5'-3' exonuclease